MKTKPEDCIYETTHGALLYPNNTIVIQNLNFSEHFGHMGNLVSNSFHR